LFGLALCEQFIETNEQLGHGHRGRELPNPPVGTLDIGGRMSIG